MLPLQTSKIPIKLSPSVLAIDLDFHYAAAYCPDPVGFFPSVLILAVTVF